MAFTSRHVAFFVCVALNFCIILFFITMKSENSVNHIHHIQQSLQLPTFRVPCKDSMSDLLPTVLELSRDIAYAEKHARGLKTTRRLRTAKSNMKQILSMFNLSYDVITARAVVNSTNICPEEYKGTKYGDPLYLKGFEVMKCDQGKSIDKLLTVIVIFNSSEKNRSVENFLTTANKFLPGVKVFASVHESLSVNSKVKKGKGFSLQSHSTGPYGAIWNKLIKTVKTKYTLFGNDVTEFDDNVSFERLIRELERLRVSAATGAFRNFDGKWREGCYQRAFRNYTVSYFEGYDESIHDCLICDHIDGPFIMRTMEASKILFDEKLQDNGLFEDFFIRLGDERSIVCLDSMFHVNKVLPKSNLSTDWAKFGKKYDLVRLQIHPGPEVIFPCEKQQKCFKFKYCVAHPCCTWELGDLVKSAMWICDQAKAVCEIFAGTLMASIKLGQILPWDVDGDITFLQRNLSKIMKVTKTFTKYKMTRMTVANKPFFRLDSKNWFVECYVKETVTSEDFMLNGKGQTKVLLNGAWLNTNKNPGQHTRNRYGPNFLRHAVHWRYTGGKDSWLIYKPDSFPKCDKPYDHKCVDNFRTDGNLQFSDPLP